MAVTSKVAESMFSFFIIVIQSISFDCKYTQIIPLYEISHVFCQNIILSFGFRENNRIFALPKGALAEWLGAGLQNLSQWFDSATHLRNPLSAMLRGGLL